MANFVSPFEKWGPEGVASDPHDTMCTYDLTRYQIDANEKIGKNNSH